MCVCVCVQRTSKRCWYRGPDQCTGRSGQPSMSMKSYKREHDLNQGWLFCERKKKEIGLNSIEMWPGRSFWKEVGRKNKIFDIGWSDTSQCQACQMEEGTEKHRLYHCPEWHAVRRGIPEAFRKWEQNAKTSKIEWRWQRGIVEHPLSGSQWNRGNFRMKMWESEKHRSWCVQVEGFKGHVATDGSL